MSSPIRIRAALAADLGNIERLLTERSLPTEGVLDHLDGFLVAEEWSAVLGCAGIERYGNLGLLRSVAVRDSVAGRGLGGQLVRAALEHAATLQLQVVYLLTTSAERYFPRFGFQAIPREEIPMELGASAELRGACPASAVAMRLTVAASR
jgi:amino-acid N-acetyltransferase